MTNTTLSQMYEIQTRFRRSARIDADITDADALAGYVLNDSAWEVLRQILLQSGESQQRAYTLTGPYGAGKSSFALFLSALLGADAEKRTKAERILGKDRRAVLFERIAAPNKGWLVLPIVGVRAEVETLVRDAMAVSIRNRWPTRKPTGLSDALAKEGQRALINALVIAAKAASAQGDGLVIVFDEMGKILEGIAEEEGDIQFFQELAEAFQRADANCLVIGVLHQSFQEYAARAGRSARNEWAKVQGRYVDIPFSVSQEDVVSLIGSAIEGPAPSKITREIARNLISHLDHPRYKGIKNFDQKLAACWPLHPMTALLLGPLSRSRFGQNERSTFGFLSSAEPAGFREFLLEASVDSDEGYLPHRLWDYLRLNLEQSILASPEAHRWSEAADAIERAAKLDDANALIIAKLIAVLDLFGRPYGLIPSEGVIRNCVQGVSKKQVDSSLKKLQQASIAVYRKHLNAWALFAGSDVDLEAAIELAHSRLGEDISSLHSYLPTLTPVIAKRHYHRTGTLRWFDVRVLNEREVGEAVARLTKDRGQSGSFVLILPGEKFDEDALRDQCRRAAQSARAEGAPLAFGLPAKNSGLVECLRDVAALDRVGANTPELEGDAVARRELNGRLNSAKARLRDVIERTLRDAVWELPVTIRKRRQKGSLARLASDVCDIVYGRAPIIHNELTNRDKPSTNAVAARRVLLYQMIKNPDAENLAIEGHPAELGLYLSILKASGFHKPSDVNGEIWEFGAPNADAERGASFEDLWEDFGQFLALTEAERQSFADLYARWRFAPFGLRHGVMPVLAVALVLARQEEIALYVDGMFTPTIDDFFIDRLLQAPNKIALQRFSMEGVRKDVLRSIGGIVATSLLGEAQSTPLAVAKPLAKFAFHLPTWVKRTKSFDKETQAIRDVLLDANDPNVLLFIDLPRACGLDHDFGGTTSEEVVEAVTSKLQRTLQELGSAYDRMLESIADTLALALSFDALSKPALEKLSERSARIEGVSGDFRLDAFARRLGDNQQNRTEWLEGLGGLAANKPVRDWTDADLERAKVELTELGRRFLRIERILVAQKKEPDVLHVNGVVGSGTATRELDVAFKLNENEMKASDGLQKLLKKALKDSRIDPNVQFATVIKLLYEMAAQDRSDETAPRGARSLNEAVDV